MHLGTTNGLYGHPGGLLEVSRLVHFQNVCTLLGKDLLQRHSCRDIGTASCAADCPVFCKIRGQDLLKEKLFSPLPERRKAGFSNWKSGSDGICFRQVRKKLEVRTKSVLTRS